MFEYLAARTACAASRFPDQAARNGVYHVQRVALAVVGADAAALVLVGIVAAREHDRGPRAAGRLDEPYTGIRERVAEFGEVAAFLDRPHQSRCFRIGNVERVIGLAAAPHADVKENPVTLVGDDVAIVVLVPDECDRRTVQRVRVLHARPVRAQDFLRRHRLARHEGPDFLAGIGTARARVADHAQHAVVRRHRDIDRRVVRLAESADCAVVDRQRPRVQRITEYPFPRFIRFVVAIEVIDVETARVGDQFCASVRSAASRSDCSVVAVVTSAFSGASVDEVRSK